MRLTILLLVTLIAVATIFDLDIILGAFAAGFILRRAMPAGDEKLEAKLDGLAFGLLIPIFFVTSGMAIDVKAVAAAPGVLLAFLVLILLVRGLPVFFAERFDRGPDLKDPPPTVRERGQVALYAATGLPLIVAVTEVAVNAGQMTESNASILVAAGAITVLVLPLTASLLGSKPSSSRSRGFPSGPGRPPAGSRRVATGCRGYPAMPGPCGPASVEAAAALGGGDLDHPVVGRAAVAVGLVHGGHPDRVLGRRARRRASWPYLSCAISDGAAVTAPVCGSSVEQRECLARGQRDGDRAAARRASRDAGPVRPGPHRDPAAPFGVTRCSRSSSGVRSVTQMFWSVGSTQTSPAPPMPDSATWGNGCDPGGPGVSAVTRAAFPPVSRDQLRRTGCRRRR